jgi:UDP-N-acetylglucosamine 2-epimerase (non-hydrolysing)
VKIINGLTARPILGDVGRDFEKITAKVREILGGNSKKGERPELWDGHAAERIVEILLE